MSMKKRLRTHTNPFNIRRRLTGTLLPDFGKFQAVNLEIGFGKGVFMQGYANRHPNELIVGMDVRQSMVNRLNSMPINPSNCVALWGTAMICLEDLIPSQSLDRVFIFHPDPWFKKRHHKRRVINQALMDALKVALKPGGRVYISTDVLDLYHDIMMVLLKNDDKIYIRDDLFWSTDYLTHWSAFSKQSHRSTFMYTFQFKETA